MTRADEAHLGLDLLDRQVVDRDGANCGKVDDLELAADEEGHLEIVAMLVGLAAWPDRLGGLSGTLARGWLRLMPSGGGPVRVPWGDVVDATSRVVLAHDRSHYGFDRADANLHRWVAAVHFRKGG